MKAADGAAFTITRRSLAALKKTDAIAYERRRNVIARLIPCNKGTLDNEVKARIKAEADDDGDVVRDLIEIGMAQKLWHSDDEGFATVARNGHLEHYRIDYPGFRAFLSTEFGKIYQRANGKGKMVPVYPIQKELKEAPFQVRSATVQHRRHGGVNGRGKGQGQGL
jgi:hypothetical protein